MYLIVGGSGYLGRYCIKNVLERTEERIVATYAHGAAPVYAHPRLEWVRTDVCDNEAWDALNRFASEPVKCIYLAAYHHPDLVEENPVTAWSINIIALAEALNRLCHLACLYYVSTDTVYGEGSKERKFTESDSCAPLNLYGRHKALAEQIVLTAGFNVVRFPFIFGPSLVEGRPHFFDRVKSDLEAGKTVEMFSDSYRSMLSFDQCAFYLIEVMEKFGACPEKIINIAADDVMSKYDAALALAEKYGLDSSLIQPVSVKQTTGIFKARRATCASLDNGKLKKLLHLSEIHFTI